MIILSVLEPTFEKAKNLINKLDKFNPTPKIQIDIVDGLLYDNKTFLEVDRLDEIDTTAQFELHLMVKNPMDYLQKRIKKVTGICTQIEALDDCTEFIKRARELNYSIGLSIGPDTNYEQLEQYLDKIDFVQFMDIYPGKQAQKQIPETLLKIKKFTDQFSQCVVQVDGSVNTKTLKGLVDAGVDNFVVGSSILKDSNPAQKYVELINMANKLKNDKNTIASIRTEKNIQKVAFLGGAAWLPKDQVYKDAYVVSKTLAEAGFEIVNGGGPGVMRASTQGAHAAGGRALAITYHPNKPKRHYEGVDPENDFDDEVITLDYFDRTKVMLQTTQAHVVFEGSLGTLSEFGMTWISSWIHHPNRKPIILYGSFWNEYLNIINRYSLVGDEEKNILKVCASPQEVLEVLRSFE